MTYGVITKVPEAGASGNTAAVLELYRADWSSGRDLDKPFAAVPLAMLNFAVPVFHLGEILILNENGRESTGKQRKPSKWDVTCEHFETVERAIERAGELPEY